MARIQNQSTGRMVLLPLDLVMPLGPVEGADDQLPLLRASRDRDGAAPAPGRPGDRSGAARQRLCFEQSNGRHEHERRIWEHVTLPDDKVVVPGVVTHQTQRVEHPELVAQRLARLTKLLGREQVIAGTDRGFVQTASTHRMPSWTQGAKLEALVERARLAANELWRRRAA